MKRLSQHLRSNIVAYLALFVALGGTSYAAAGVPVGSAARSGNSRAARHAKPRPVAAVVREWAVVGASGRLLGFGPVRPRYVRANGEGATVVFARRQPGRCFVMGNVEGQPVPPAASASFDLLGNREVDARTFNATGPVAAGVAVAVLCSP